MNSGLNPADPTLVAACRSAGASTWSATVNAVSFGQENNPVAAGSCARRGVAGVFADDGGTKP
jgi:hypothetical protein